MNAPAPELAAFIRDFGLADQSEVGSWTPLSGGVSSDIWRVDTSKKTFCVKRALSKLKVKADWQVDTSRNAFEWAYLEAASLIVPGSVPEPLAHDPKRGLFAMAWLEPERFKLWKSELLAGRSDAQFAASVGALIGKLHAASANNAAFAARFATDTNFHALRLDPYLLEVGRVHPDLADFLHALASQTANHRIALVHGDVSPKNILIGPESPVLLDAEVAWYGDPAFDLAFCLTHLAIKAMFVDGASIAISQAFEAFHVAYLRLVDWERPDVLEGRAALLLPSLALARVDGKSPVEYLDEKQRQKLRSSAIATLKTRPSTLAEAFHGLTKF